MKNDSNIETKDPSSILLENIRSAGRKVKITEDHMNYIVFAD